MKSLLAWTERCLLRLFRKLWNRQNFHLKAEMFSFHSKYFVYRELKRAPQKLSFCFKCPDTGTVRILGNILYFTPCLSRLFSSSFSVNSSCIFFPFLSHASSPSFSLYCYVIATVLFWIWQTRNLATFRNSVLNVNQIVNLIKKDISCRILGAKQDEKENFWSTGSILCKISDTRSISFFPYCS